MGKRVSTVFVPTRLPAAILDLHLPKLSGQHLCKEMKAAAPSIPIIILTASCDLNDKVILLEMGADDYVTKPLVRGNCWPG